MTKVVCKQAWVLSYCTHIVAKCKDEEKKKTSCIFGCPIYGNSYQRSIIWYKLKIYSTSPKRPAEAAELSTLFIASWIQQQTAGEEKTWFALSLSLGVNYDFPSNGEPGEADWMVIHQPGCLHPLKQCVTPGCKEGQKRKPSTLIHIHTYAHP